MIGNFIAGDYSNNITGTTSSIAGGSGNIIANMGVSSTIAGGEKNKILTNDPKRNWNTIGGGRSNTIYLGNYCTIAGGHSNDITGSSSYGFIGGGYDNNIYNSDYGFIGGGDSNTITGNSNYSTIPGGFFNEINNAIYSFAVGVRAKANSNNSFVWNSDNGADFTSIKTGTFIINVPWGSSPDKGGVGINTNNPEALLDVNGKIKAKNIELDKRSPTVTSGGSCGGENPGTIIYDGVGFYGCGPSNTRKRLD